MTHVGVVVAERNAAIVTVEWDEDDRLRVTGIERLPADLAAVASRVRELDPETSVVIDAEGLGSALWAVLGSPADTKHRRLYSGRGLERQALVDELLVAIAEDRFRFAPRLGEQAPMTKALSSYRRQVGVDGLIGPELVVALLLALIPPVPELVPLIAWR